VVLHSHVLAFEITLFTEPFKKRGGLGPGRTGRHTADKADYRHGRLLRARGERQELGWQRRLRLAQRPCCARLPDGRSQQSPGDRSRCERRGLRGQELGGVSGLFLGACSGPCLCGQMERRAKKWCAPRHGRLWRDGPRPKRGSEILAQHRHVGGGDAQSVRPGLSARGRERRARSHGRTQHRNGATRVCGKPAARLDHDRRFGSDLCQFPRIPAPC